MRAFVQFAFVVTLILKEKGGSVILKWDQAELLCAKLYNSSCLYHFMAVPRLMG